MDFRRTAGDAAARRGPRTFVGLRDDQRGRDVGRAVPAAERRQAGGGPLCGRRYRHFETQLRHLPDTCLLYTS